MSTKAARMAANRRWKEKNRERLAAEQKAYREAHPGHAEQYRNREESRRRHSELARPRHFLYKYNITLDELYERMDAQNLRCAICGILRGPSLCVDHDHKTRKIRGLLCKKCNTGIGLLGDSADILERAAKYLRDAEGKPDP